MLLWMFNKQADFMSIRFVVTGWPLLNGKPLLTFVFYGKTTILERILVISGWPENNIPNSNLLFKWKYEYYTGLCVDYVVSLKGQQLVFRMIDWRWAFLK